MLISAALKIYQYFAIQLQNWLHYKPKSALITLQTHTGYRIRVSIFSKKYKTGLHMFNRKDVMFKWTGQ